MNLDRLNLDKLKNIHYQTTTKHTCIHASALLHCIAATETATSILSEGIAGGVGAMLAGPPGALIGVTGELVVSCVIGAISGSYHNSCDH